MNMRTKRDVDAHLRCSCCKEMTGGYTNLLKMEHGNIEYIDHLDINAFDPHEGQEFYACEVCTRHAFEWLIDEWEEGVEAAIEYGVDLDAVDPSWVLETFMSSDDVPRTWFSVDEPDQCPKCGETHETGDEVVQFSIVHREGRFFSNPIPQGGIRYTWCCLSCVSEFYDQVRK